MQQMNRVLLVVTLLPLLSSHVHAAERYWELVFKGVSGKRGGSNDIYNLWSGPNTRNENNRVARQLGHYSSGHYKSPLVNRWDVSSFTKIKLSGITNGQERTSFTFQSASTDRLDWMSKGNLIDSGHGIVTYNFFSVAGEGRKEVMRRFFISEKYDGCPKDTGWFVVAEHHCCDWSTSAPLPNIKYSPNSRSINFNNAEEADEMAVYFYMECPKIDNCADVHCTTAEDKFCRRCRDTALFKLDNHGKRCARKCSYDNRWCWPGECAEEYARSCTCAPGFKRVYNSTTAVCQPDKPPVIITCQLRVESMTKVQAISRTNGTSECQNQKDIFGNFQLHRITTTMEAVFKINLPKEYENLITKINFVNFHLFGITDAHIVLMKTSSTGVRTKIQEIPIKADVTGEMAEETFSKTLNITYMGPDLTDGERLCVGYFVKGGGFLQSQNVFDSGPNRFRNVSYEKTHSTKDLCYIYDNTPPEHSSGHSEPLAVHETLLHHTTSVNATFVDWIDRSPVPGKQLSSGIYSYEISLYEVTEATKTLLERGLKSLIPKLVTNVSSVSIEIPLNSRSPSLFCVFLEVKDGAQNVRQSRRFVLYDNSSKISCHKENKLYTISASNKTNGLWQTNHGPICYSWKDRYINDRYRNFNPLRAIKPEPYGLITGKYDQLTGQLPVTGTENVYGIINFRYSLHKNKIVIIPTTDVPNFTSQKLCVTVPVTDGDTFDLHLDSIDIMSNVYNDSTVVHIDRSVPEIKNIWLVKDGYRQLYVHNSNDLREMKLSFEVFDPHSGIKTVQWRFSNKDGGDNIGSGALQVVRLATNISCPDHASCYCPSVGQCAYYNFTLSMPKLRVSAQHNRRYFFGLKVTNEAMLTVIEHIDILVDESPPESGVVMEGFVGAPDIDYTSEGTVMAHWKGFIDHESGIRLYRVALADHCLNKEELDQHYANASSFNVSETTDDKIQLSLPGYGKYFTSVIAFNNAMEPSAIACSDGIVHDNTAPHITNVTLESASIAETVACSDGQAWFINRDLYKVFLNTTINECLIRCRNSSRNQFIELLPLKEKEDGDMEITTFLCSRMSTYNKNLIYLPNDKILLKWVIDDDFSQIHEIQIGIGSSAGNKQLPDLFGYKKTQHSNFYHHQHTGLSTGTEFFIFIKAVNKAGLATISAYGPVLIDETPPTCRTPFVTEIRDAHVLLVWNSTTCYDFEQKEEIGSIFFRIGFDEHHVTPFLEWKLGYSLTCDHGSPNYRCIKYPISHLQRYDSEGAEWFYFDLHVFNYAGHYYEVRSTHFTIPSYLAPPKAIVIDVDPEMVYSDNKEDTDTIFNQQRFCTAWRFQKNVFGITSYIGLGSKPTLDNIMTYTRVNETVLQFCANITDFVVNTRYYITLKSSRNNSTTYSTSNGFVVFDESAITSSLLVFDGKGCNNGSVIDLLELDSVLGKHVKRPFKSKSVFYVGSFYSAKVHYNLTLKSEDIIIRNYTLSFETKLITFIAMKERPLFYIEGFLFSHKKIMVEFQSCVQDVDFEMNLSKLSANWIMNYGKQLITHFEISFLKPNEKTCPRPFDVLPSLHEVGADSLNFTYDNILQDGFYVATVKPCTRHHCMGAVTSNGVWIGTTYVETGQIKAIMSTSEEECQFISLDFEDFSCSSLNDSSNITFYRWATFQDHLGNKQLSNWITLQGNNQTHRRKDSKCVKLPVYPYAASFVCLEGICLSGTSRKRCVPLMINEDPNEYNKRTVYEIDVDKVTVNQKSAIYSSNIGNALTWLHKMELDFISKRAELGGIITGIEDRQVTWYIQTSSKFHFSPSECTESNDCIVSMQTSGGFASFPKLDLMENKVYYICANVNATTVIREGRTKQNIEGFQLCGDGFIVDNSPPNKGTANIVSDKGYITTNGHLAVEWKGFQDVFAFEQLGYPSGISHYSYAIGTFPYHEDVLPLTATGLSEAVLRNDLVLKPGFSYYATVHAYDHVGHVTKVTSCGILFDNTPPITGYVHVGKSNYNRYAINTNHIHVQWFGFRDNESGIKTFEAGIGSTAHHPDIVPFTVYTGDHAVIRRDEGLQDGYHYYIFLRVTNHAGLSSLTLSDRLIFDASPPTLGVVKDGFVSEKKDFDYQINTTHIGCHWDGFDDPHSGISYYNVGLETVRGLSDITAMTYSSLKQEIVWILDFELGVKYYCRVEACNSAGLCSSQTSNGIIIDNSAPIPGVIHIGIAGTHSKYFSQKDTIQAQWLGFQDPHSDISHFEVCVGSRPGSVCDLMPLTNYLLSSSITKTGLNMTVGSSLFLTVRAYNKAGLHVDKTSDSFAIDTSPPVLITRPYFQTNDTVSSKGTKIHFDVSYLKLVWKFEDKQSPIVKQTLSLRTHHDGHTPIEELLLTSENELLLTFAPKDWLHSGDTYMVDVTSCNQAGLCTAATSNGILIDSTPPHLGGFKQPMTWKTVSTHTQRYSALNVTWYGFSDPESGIKQYFITVGSTYSGSELSDGVIEVDASTHLSDGEQQAQIKLAKEISNYQTIILSIWAKNFAGLVSSYRKTTVKTVVSNPSLSEGFLSIEKHSCPVEYCNKDCTCAVVGKACNDVEMNSTCEEISHNSQGFNFTVDVVLSTTVQGITSSSSCITGKWNLVSKYPTRKIYRYEWSAGRKGFPVGYGISGNEKVWHDIGNQSSFTYCVKKDHGLVNGAKYLVYVKVWLSHTTFSIFESSPVLVDITPPSIRKGRFVRISDDTCNTNLKYSNKTTTLTSCWDNVFYDEESGIRNYFVNVGTTQAGSDIVQSQNVYTETRFTWNNITLRAGTKYYVTVFAFNNAGLQTSASSYGLTIDTEKPYSGVVFNTALHKNVISQYSSNFGISFHGFEDHHSSIKTYYVAIREETVTGNVIGFKNVGISNSFVLNELNLTHGRRYRALLKAVDAAGYESDMVMSPLLLIDKTPPIGFSCEEFQSVHNVNVPAINKTISWIFDQLNSGKILYKLRVSLNPSPIHDTFVMTTKSFTRQLFLFRNHDGSSETEIQLLTKLNDSFSLHGEPVLETSEAHIEINKCVSLRLNKINSSFVTVRQISPSSLTVDIRVLDNESGIKKIYVGVGSTFGGFQVKPLEQTSLEINHVFPVDVPHASPIYVTALVENNAGSKTQFHSKPISFDNTPPHIENVKIDFRMNLSHDSTTRINVHWVSFDNESGVKLCYCSVAKDSIILLHWTPTTDGFILSDWIHLKHGTPVKAKVRCVNTVGLESETRSQEYISFAAPDHTGSVIKFKHKAVVESGLNVQTSMSQITFSWIDFTDPVGITSYLCRVLDGVTPLTDWQNVGLHNYALFEELTLKNDHVYMAEVIAVNQNELYSQTINNSILVLNVIPQLTGRPAVLRREGSVATLDWRRVFIVDDRLDVTYEVSVGTTSGSSDVLRNVMVKQTHITMEISTTELFIVIHARYNIGTTQVYTQTLN